MDLDRYEIVEHDAMRGRRLVRFADEGDESSSEESEESDSDDEEDGEGQEEEKEEVSSINWGEVYVTYKDYFFTVSRAISSLLVRPLGLLPLPALYNSKLRPSCKPRPLLLPAHHPCLGSSHSLRDWASPQAPLLGSPRPAGPALECRLLLSR